MTLNICDFFLFFLFSVFYGMNSPACVHSRPDRQKTNGKLKV